MGIFIYAFTATGKSTLAKKHKNIIDMESVGYKYLNEKINSEERKSSSDRIPNPQWPQNYFEALEKVKDKYDYILISDDICDSYLQKNNYEYWQVYPNINLKQEYINRCKKRGNNEIFISNLSKNWDNWCKQCKNDKNATKHIELQKGQYLEDILNFIKN